MSEKGIISLEQHMCLVCAKPYDTGSILIQTRFTSRAMQGDLDPTTITRWGMCPEHQRMADEGYIALVECDATRTPPNVMVDPSAAYRTGRLCHARRHVVERFVDPATIVPVMFIDVDGMEMFIRLFNTIPKEGGPRS